MCFSINNIKCGIFLLLFCFQKKKAFYNSFEQLVPRVLILTGTRSLITYICGRG